MDPRQRKRINKFAIIVILIIAVPELVGHLYFDNQKHPTNSSVNAALSLTDKQHSVYTNNDSRCHLVIQNDTSGGNVSRAAGLQGQYGTYTCT